VFAFFVETITKQKKYVPFSAEKAIFLSKFHGLPRGK
jgi:hypothetical protein